MMGHAFTARRAFTFIELLVVISIISLLIAAFWLSADAAPPPATEKAPAYYVAVDGKPGNSGTHESPWDILSALGGKQVVAPGATIYLRGGTYRKDRGPNPGNFYEKDGEKTVVGLSGAEGRAIHVRPVAGERVIIDGGLSVEPPSAHLWMWDLEILVSEPHPEKPVGPGSHPKDFHRPWGGLNIAGGHHLKFINFLIHDNRQGVGWWTANQESELYGAIIYDNGWPATDRGHGHCVYSQNKTGIKRITDCILTCKYHGTYTMHAYGSPRADCDNFVMEGNIAYALGTFLVGSGKPSHNIVVRNNALYGVGMQIGYNAPYNENCEVRDNVVVNGSLSIVDYKEAVNEGNLVVGQKAKRPAEPRVLFRPNRYDPTRAHLAVFNFAKAKTVEVDTAGFLKDGDAYALKDPKDFYGPPVHAGACKGGKITVPMAREFAVFVLRKTAS